MHCGRVSNLLSAYLDRELAGAEMLQIRRHLDDCSGCAAEHAALSRVKGMLSGAPAPEPAGDPVAAVMRRWAERSEAAPVAPYGGRVSPFLRRWRRPRFSLPPAWQRCGAGFA